MSFTNMVFVIDGSMKLIFVVLSAAIFSATGKVTTAKKNGRILNYYN
jgi:hypothetical protein